MLGPATVALVHQHQVRAASSLIAVRIVRGRTITWKTPRTTTGSAWPIVFGESIDSSLRSWRAPHNPLVRTASRMGVLVDAPLYAQGKMPRARTRRPAEAVW